MPAPPQSATPTASFLRLCLRQVFGLQRPWGMCRMVRPEFRIPDRDSGPRFCYR